MRFRTLGRTGLQISEMGYGAWGIGGLQWQGGNDDESRNSLRRALELGLNLIDTALAYNEGHSERLIGETLRETGAQAYVATKIPPKNRTWPAQPGIPLSEVFPYQYILDCTETSLRNLGVETLDLQQLHVWNPEWLGQDDWQRGLEDIKQSGKARFVGISINDHQPDSALSLIETGAIDTVQVILNIFDQTPTQNLLPLCQQHQIGVLARCPLDEGSLTGTINEDTQFQPGEFRDMYFRGDRKREVREHVEALVADLGIRPDELPDIALQYCLAQEAVSTVIPGMRRTRNVERNCAVSDAPQLPAETLAILQRHAWGKNYYQ